MVTTPTVWSTDVRANTTAAGTQGDPKVIGLADGGYYVVWVEQFGSASNQNKIYGQRYDVLGNAVDGEAHIGPGTTPNFIYKGDPDIAQLSDGRLAIVYGDQRFVYVAVSDSSLGNFSNVVLHENAAIVGSTDPSVTALDGGAYEVTYTQEAPVGSAGLDIAGSRYNGATPSASYLISGTTDFDRSETATLVNGNFVVVYQRDASGTSERNIDYAVRTPEGGFVAGGAVIGATSSTADEAEPKVAALSGGGFVVVWEDGTSGAYDIYATVYTSTGASVPQAFNLLVSATATGNQTHASVTGLKDGGFLVAWNDADTSLARAQRFSDSGAKVGDEFTLGTGVSNASNSVGRIDLTTLEDGRVVVARHTIVQDNGDITVSIWDPRDSVINGSAGDDSLTSRHEGASVNGLGGTDDLYGLEGSDTLDGGTGLDTLRGGGGDDIYMLSSVTGALPGNRHYDTVIESPDQGTDTVLVTGVSKGPSYTLTANVENAEVVGAVRLTLSGNGIANRLTGHGLGHLKGMGGDDTYLVSAGDIADETGGSGTDTVETAASFSLSDASQAIGDIEKIVLTGSAAADLTGNGLANTLTGNDATNALDGGAGADHMTGRGGNDVYTIDDAGDVADESGGSGADTVKSSISFSLANAAHAKGTIETLILTGSAATGTGNGGANTLAGNGAKNTLSGGSGNDTVSGNGGDDKLVGGSGNDKLDGGTGADKFIGGSGADDMTAGSGDTKDVFVFTSKSDSGHGSKSSGWDQIFGFDAKSGNEKISDRIDLSAIDADKHQKHDQAFRFVDHFTKAHGKEPDGEVMLDEHGKNIKVLVDIDGNKHADLIIQVMDLAHLHKADFVL